MDNTINQTIIEKVAIQKTAIYKAIAMLPPPEIKDLWAEKNSTDQKVNLTRKEEFVKENSITETKTDSTPKDWRDITDPEMRRKMYLKAYNKAYSKTYRVTNKNKLKEYKKSWREVNKDKIKEQDKVYRATNKDKLKERGKVYHTVNKVKIQKRQKVYYNDNKDEILKRQRVYRQNNKDKVNGQGKTYREANKDKIKKRGKAYYEANKDKLNEHRRNRAKNDVQFKLTINLRTRLRHAIRGNFKSGSAVEDLGCSIDELKSYLESKFLPGMSWDNWSKDGWHIDHIKPLASFDLTDHKQLLEACHYTNLQPLWANDNLSKSDKIN